jgi:hypothetical protein
VERVSDYNIRSRGVKAPALTMIKLTDPEPEIEFFFPKTEMVAYEERLPLFIELLRWQPENLSEVFGFESVDQMFEAFNMNGTIQDFMKLKVDAFTNLFGGMPLNTMLREFYRSQDEKENKMA